MSDVFADLHIHIGRTYTGKAVKITGSRNLTLSNILKAAKYPKGLDMVGVIDCHSPEVIIEIEQLIHEEKLVKMQEGGFRYEDEVTLISKAKQCAAVRSCAITPGTRCYGSRDAGIPLKWVTLRADTG